MPEPRRLFEAQIFHYPTDDRLTANKNQAGNMYDHLENIKNLNFCFTIGPPTYAGKFKKDVIQMENNPSYEEYQQTSEWEKSVADVSISEVNLILAAGHFFSSNDEHHHGHNGDRRYTEHNDLRNIVSNFDPCLSGFVIVIFWPSRQ